MPNVLQLKKAKDFKGLEEIILGEDDLLARLNAIKAIAEIGEGEAERILIEQLNSDDLPVREAAARALGNLKAESAIPVLSNMADNVGPDGKAARGAIEEISALLQKAPTEEPPDPNATKACPMCGETILAVAKKCKHCQTFFDESATSGTTTSASQSTASSPDVMGVLLLLLPLIGGVLLFLSWYKASGEFSVMEAGEVFSTSYQLLISAFVVVLVGSAILVAIDAATLGYGKDERSKVVALRTGPAAWAFGQLLIWIIAYPWYMSARTHASKRATDFAAGAILFSILFLLGSVTVSMLYSTRQKLVLSQMHERLNAIGSISDAESHESISQVEEGLVPDDCISLCDLECRKKIREFGDAVTEEELTTCVRICSLRCRR